LERFKKDCVNRVKRKFLVEKDNKDWNGIGKKVGRDKMIKIRETRQLEYLET